MTNPSRVGFWKRSQMSKCLDFPSAVQALFLLVEDQNEPPLIGNFDPANNRRRFCRSRPTAVNDQPSEFEGADPDAGSRSAVGQARYFPYRQVVAEQMTDRKAGRERHLRSRAQSDVFRDGLLDFNMDAVPNPECIEEILCDLENPFRLRTVRFQMVRPADRDPGRDFI